MGTAFSLLTESNEKVPTALIEWLRQSDSPLPHYDAKEGETGIYDLGELLAEIDRKPELRPPADVLKWLRDMRAIDPCISNVL